ncbi:MULTISPECIES: galactosyltransferase-related protein [unclassified Leptolyngbya]|uniref:galactosyltransferase-related protein n=1 Tax=unclassified Leptolyngbya TaxID=2650499 RepID=UPI001686493F|nr:MULTISPECIES: galactosyltransferase-related protein [unclassified Leptolyngbya]MBD1909058.1 glycosyltransferase [Leptolyngbya sp. FACHB-8]MBD2157439.1 glycosyltransferase [Leptolyngbya sp. FACHB-16]
MNKSVKASLIIPYRQREIHLKTQLEWWKHQKDNDYSNNFEIILVEASETPSTWIQSAFQSENLSYIHYPCKGTFHKTKALNLGLNLAQGEFVVPYDVDLLPVRDVLLQHLWVAERSPELLITGYRIMSNTESIAFEEVASVLEQTSIAPEDQPTALWKHLVLHEKFGIMPFFRKDRLLKIGGWDEQFIGWGGEDQDVIERYLKTGCHLCRCPELVYLHLFHQPDTHWTEPHIVAQNRQHYYTKANPNFDEALHK